MSSSLTYLKGNKKDGAKFQVSIRAAYDGTASISTYSTTRRNGSIEDSDMDDHDFSSCREAELFALDLARKKKAEGFLLSGGPEKENEPGEDAEKGRYVKESLIGSFGPRKGGSAHSANLHDLTKIFAHDHFPGCRLPPVHVAGIDLSQVPIFPDKVRAFGMLHLFYSNHEDCDAWMLDHEEETGAMSFRKDEAGRTSILNFEAFDESCDGGDPQQVRRGPEWDLHLETPDPDRLSVRGLRVGGAPAWWQSKAWPECPECATSMFFVAEVRAIQCPPGNAAGDQLLNIFLCEDCRIGTTVMQCT